jgi:hypothetical protein
MKTLLMLLALGLLLTAPAMAQWVEDGDAGDLPATAQIPIGSGALATIAGTIIANDVDMYCIQVTAPTTFSAQTCGAGATWDTQLFLFRSDGVGVKWDDDTCDPGLQSLISDFSACQHSSGPGLYYIAISKYNKDPLNAAGGAVFSTAMGCNTNAAVPVASWGTTTTTLGGPYTITLASTEYCGTVAVEQATWGTIKSLYR